MKFFKNGSLRWGRSRTQETRGLCATFWWEASRAGTTRGPLSGICFGGRKRRSFANSHDRTNSAGGAGDRDARARRVGHRSHQTAHVEGRDFPSVCDGENLASLPTPDPSPNPKRAKTTGALVEGDGNKENIPPFVTEVINSSSPTSIRRTRSLRRMNTMVHESPSRTNTPRRYSSTSNLRHAVATPATSLSQLSLATPPPSPPIILQPLHVRVKALLRPTCNDGLEMAGREQERSQIEAFFQDFIHGVSNRSSSALYISGSPGTGKTALVNTVLEALKDDVMKANIELMVVNCMALNGVDAVWQQLADMTSASAKPKGRGKKSKDSPQQVVQKALTTSERKCIVVLDDALSVVCIAHASSANIRLVGIANTHTLTAASSTTLSVQSLAGVDTLHFAPYSGEQLLGILRARLAPLSADDEDLAARAQKFLPLPALTLLSKKIAAQTGDVRAVFEVLRSAINIVMNNVSSENPSALRFPLWKDGPLPTPSSAPSTVRKASDSETVTKVRELGLQQRLVLLAALLATKSSDAGVSLNASSPSRSPVKRTQSTAAAQPSTGKIAAFDMGHLHAFYTAILARAESSVFAPVSRSEFGDLAGVLEVIGLLALSSSSSLPSTPRKAGKKSFSRTMSFTGSPSTQDVRFVEDVRLDEVTRGLGLGADDTPTDAREEELRAIFQREQARIAREAKARGRPDAMES
ncbi:P-loop containing nucleoside triphosphate hydrolase protein [Epithele typhae]|uniref:P-loop containing nucleoside triphosphate hydrolase protein n=1 Tax=Epithele typhae TaxID=378194 RepID=UPI0020080734|nr:P-loop containing nucleoside triphosphate hydrolase protein [Epithele typhae]KAH9942300.1 P-loop containing nucleoside triphosphate hydrolase protein [Epithele typhae]